jgi:CBS domain-containing protein
MMAMTKTNTLVSQLLRRKGSQAYVTRPDATVYEALQVMAEKNIGALLVVDTDGLAGIFSERDYARKVILQGKSSKDTPVSEIMTSRVYFVRPDNTIEDCMVLMTEKKIRHLPVIEGGHIAGVISIGDVVKEVIDEQGFVIEQLENYITGGR